MTKLNYKTLALKMIVFIFGVSFQTIVNGQTIDKPVEINLELQDQKVAPGSKSAVIVTFKIPKWIWLGAEKGAARTPPGTVVKAIANESVSFGETQFPEPFVEGVPAKLGVSRVYKEMLKVIVPFTVNENAKEGEVDLTFTITYTPGYSAGRMGTHLNEEYTTKLIIDTKAKVGNVIPKPENGTVPDDFIVGPKEYDVPSTFKFLFTPLNEEKSFTKVLHAVWLDKPGHGKSVRFMPFPFANTDNITGSSLGMGMNFFNSTREGTMTGMVSFLGYSNDLIGSAFGLQLISCPGAYHNYQFFSTFGGEGYRFVALHYENLTLNNWGVELTAQSINEPRTRFYGLGAQSRGEDETSYEKENNTGILDVYYLKRQNLRVGLGISYEDVNVGRSFDKVVEDGAPLLHDNAFSSFLIGFNGSQTLGGRVNIVYDHRDQEFSPSKGFYGKVTAQANTVSYDDEAVSGEEEYINVEVDMRQYFSGPSQKLVVLLRNNWVFNTASDIPFYNLASVGGLNSMRAYNEDRFLGQYSFFSSMEMRYTLFKVPILGYPMSIEMGGFLDVGQVFGDGQTLGDELNVDPGVSMRMINKPNVGLVLNYAWGEDGAYFTGGIGLPF